jgi:hypothetical protein
MQATYLKKVLKTFKNSDVQRFKRYIYFHLPNQSEIFSEMLDVLIELDEYTDEEHLMQKLYRFYPKDILSKKLYELKNIVEQFTINYLSVNEDKYTSLNNKVVFSRYLRNHNLIDFHISEFKHNLKSIEHQIKDEDFRTIHINLLNEARKYFYHKYYVENDFKTQSVHENYQDLKKIKQWIQHSHLLDKIFYDFSLKAAFKIEENTLQHGHNHSFEPTFFDFQTYLLFLNSTEIPLLYKTFILDIVEGTDEVSPEAYQHSVVNIFKSNYESASVNVKYNLLVALIASEKTNSDQRISYYEQLVELKSELNPGILHTYIMECLDKDVQKSRKEFNRLKAKAINDTENELLALDGIIYSYEKNFEKALQILNKVIVYQQDNNYFEVNLALLNANLAKGEIEVADSILKKLNVFFHKYKESLHPDLALKYNARLIELKKVISK